ncbi:MAG: hypothetical protein LBE18_00450 [Planctomycetaceae bacterium]|jgi:hypothetical protein|nr:hypothetical protein [Planctomycetaceae bacterium]
MSNTNNNDAYVGCGCIGLIVTLGLLIFICYAAGTMSPEDFFIFSWIAGTAGIVSLSLLIIFPICNNMAIPKEISLESLCSKKDDVYTSLLNDYWMSKFRLGYISAVLFFQKVKFPCLITTVENYVESLTASEVNPLVKTADYINIKLGRIGIDDNIDERMFKIDPNAKVDVLVFFGVNSKNLRNADISRPFPLGNNIVLFLIYPKEFKHIIEINEIFKFQIQYASVFSTELKNNCANVNVSLDEKDKLAKNIVNARIQELEQHIIDSFDKILHKHLGISTNQYFAQNVSELDAQRLMYSAKQSILSPQKILQDYNEIFPESVDLKNKINAIWANLKSYHIEGFLGDFYEDLKNKGIDTTNLRIISSGDIVLQDEFKQFMEFDDEVLNDIKKVSQANRQRLDKATNNNVELEDAITKGILRQQINIPLQLPAQQDIDYLPDTTGIGPSEDI